MMKTYFIHDRFNPSPKSPKKNKVAFMWELSLNLGYYIVNT